MGGSDWQLLAIVQKWEIFLIEKYNRRLCVVLACLFTMGNIPSYFHVSVHCNTDHSLIQRKMQTINYSLFSSNKWFLSSVPQQFRVSVWQSVRYFFIFYWLRTEERHWDTAQGLASVSWLMTGHISWDFTIYYFMKTTIYHVDMPGLLSVDIFQHQLISLVTCSGPGRFITYEICVSV